MKTMSKRILCFIISACICCTVLPLAFGVVADANEPKLSSNCETVIELEGKDTVFGTESSDLRINSRIKFDAGKDLSAVDTIELSVFVEKSRALKQALSDEYSFALYFSSNSSRENRNRSYADISAQIVNDGWNTVRIEKTDFTEGVNWSSVRYIYLGFTNEENDLPIALANTIVKYKNVCDVLNIMSNKDSDMVIFDNAIFNTLGDNENSLIKDIPNRFSAEFGAKDISKASVIKIDFYIPNYKEYIAFSKQNKMKVTFLSAGGQKYIESVEKYVVAKESGWYTVTIDVDEMKTNSNFDATKVTGFKLEYKAEENAVLGSAYSIGLAISNIRGFESVISPSAMISKDGKSGVYGATYETVKTNSEIKLDTPIDATVAKNIAFDFYVEDYDAFKNMLANSSKPLYLVLGTSENKANACALYDFTKQVKGAGWNHIELEADKYSLSLGGDVNLKTVYYVYLSFKDETASNSYANLAFNITDICVINSAIDIKPEPPKYSVAISLDGITETWGKQYNWTMDNFSWDFRENPIDLESVDRFEFDIYIEDYEAFKSAVKGRRINFATANSDIKTKTRIRFDFEEQITKSGWNHIVLEKINRWWVDSNFTYSSTKWVMIFFQDGGSDDNPIADTKVRIANLVGSHADHHYLPELPENVIAQLGNAEDGTDSIGNTVGDKFHYTLDRLYREKLSPVDFSKSPVIEFDIYISDYEKFLAAENDPTDGQKSKLNFVVSSTAPGLWSQYSTPRAYYSSGIDLADYITHSGWNHVRVGKSEFQTKNHGVDWSALTAYMIYYRNSSNLYPYDNVNKDLYVKIANVVNTGVIANIPANKEAKLKPDKNAVYISSVEALSDDYGVWNIENPTLSTKYKTAGKASLHKTVNYSNELADTYMSYIFDGSANMSDLKTLKFDFFIDLPQYLNKPTNKVEIILGNNRFGKDDYYSLELNLADMKAGWNSVSLNIKNATKVGKPDLKSIKLIMIRFTEIGLSADNFEEIVYGIDNLRYISSTGNKKLRIISDDVGFESDVSTEEEIVEEEIIIDDEPVSAQTKIIKTIQKIIVPDYLTVAIILGAEALVLLVGGILFIIIYRKKRIK